MLKKPKTIDGRREEEKQDIEHGRRKTNARLLSTFASESKKNLPFTVNFASCSKQMFPYYSIHVINQIPPIVFFHLRPSGFPNTDGI